MPFYDYQCLNEDCKAKGINQEMYTSISERDTIKPKCMSCDQELTRSLTWNQKIPDISWSKWRVDIGINNR